VCVCVCACARVVSRWIQGIQPDPFLTRLMIEPNLSQKCMKNFSKPKGPLTGWLSAAEARVPKTSQGLFREPTLACHPADPLALKPSILHPQGSESLIN
jgi:hypothetical protein